MAAIAKKISELDESELRTNLERFGESVGPLTESTRPLFERRLAKLLGKDDENDEQTNANSCTKFGVGVEFGAIATPVVGKATDPASHLEKDSTVNVDTKSGEFDLANPVLYYGVTIPHVLTAEDDDFEGVYTDKKEALRAVKKYKGSRFKAFKTHAEAIGFASQSDEKSVSSPFSRNGSASTSAKEPESINDANGIAPSGEKISPFRAPKSQDLVKLRKAIECGDAEFVTQTIWSNPRYLVSSGDTPAILQEGSRYNALHVACKSKQLNMVKVILQTIENPEFMAMLYSDDTEATCLQRVDFLTDLYLNTPDKGLCETPLHFSVKFGCVKIVELLTSHIACDRERKNKYDQAPRDIICSRCPNASPELKAEIEEFLQDRYYVPVLRTEDNCVQPLIGEPWSPESKKPVFSSFDVSSLSPVQVPMSVKAYAGPMSPQQAKEFHKRMKTSGMKTVRSKSLDIRLSDTDKGLERIGRVIAKDMKVLWTEHWSFLQSYCDLAKPDGLGKLESYLKQKLSELVAKENSGNYSMSDKTDDEIYVSDTSSKLGLSSSKKNSSGLSALCEALEKLQLSSGSSIMSGGDGSPQLMFSRGQVLCSSANNGVHSDGTNNNGSSPKSINVSSFLDRTCKVVSNQIYVEIMQFADAPDEYWLPSCLPYRLFTKAILPFVECLLNIVSNLRLCDELKSSDFQTVHFEIAVKVCNAIEEDDNVCARSFVKKISTVSEIDVLEAMLDLSEEDVDTWARHRTTEKKHRLSVAIQQHVQCILQMLSLVLPNSKSAPVECKCSWLGYHPDGNTAVTALVQTSSKSAGDHATGTIRETCELETNQETPPQPISCPDKSYPGVEDAFELSVSPVKSDISIYYTPPSSQCSSSSELTTADEGPAVFLDGLFPTKLDVDILRAIQHVSVDPLQYPHIYRWKNLVTSYPTDVVESWPSPLCPKTRQASHRLSSLSFSSAPPRRVRSSSSPVEWLRPLTSTPTKVLSEDKETLSPRLNITKAFLLFDTDQT